MCHLFIRYIWFANWAVNWHIKANCMCQIRWIFLTHSHMTHHKYVPRIVWTRLNWTFVQEKSGCVVSTTYIDRYVKTDTYQNHARTFKAVQKRRKFFEPDNCWRQDTDMDFEPEFKFLSNIQKLWILPANKTILLLIV